MVVGKRGSAAVAGSGDLVLTVKIGLLDASPRIWRRVLVPASFTLGDLHHVVQLTMGWEDSHLHVFLVRGRRFSIPVDDDRDVSEDEDADSVALAELGLARAGATLRYVYDFGDHWEHELKVESVGTRQPGAVYPHCVRAVRACPPEDCGGVHGYRRMLRILGNPGHAEHDQLRDWLGRELAPKTVDLQAINALLARSFRR